MLGTERHIDDCVKVYWLKVQYQVSSASRLDANRVSYLFCNTPQPETPDAPEKFRC